MSEMSAKRLLGTLCPFALVIKDGRKPDPCTKRMSQHNHLFDCLRNAHSPRARAASPMITSLNMGNGRGSIHRPHERRMSYNVGGGTGRRQAMAGERRWIILSEDGRHATLGRDTDPTPAEIKAASAGLSAQGLGGWLAVMDGPYHRTRGRLTLMMVRPVAPYSVAWEQAVEAFQEIRRERNAAAA